MLKIIKFVLIFINGLVTGASLLLNILGFLAALGWYEAMTNSDLVLERKNGKFKLVENTHNEESVS